jgi:hypothetical protein
MDELVGITILLLQVMHDDVSPSPPTSMHSWRIDIPGFWEGGMLILRENIEVGGEGDTSSCSNWSGRMEIPTNSFMDEVNNP